MQFITPKFLFIALVIILVFVILFNPSENNRYVEVHVGNIKVNAEVADTFLKRTRGLMGRKSLQENEGMIFSFDTEGYYGFWMMNMEFPIDIVFISENKTVVDFMKNVQPCELVCETHRPREKTMYVLEVEANFAEKHELKIGSKVDFELDY